MRRGRKSCAYCGDQGHKLEREHVIPRCLYPASKSTSRIQRITVLSCGRCNRGWSDDEAHFRNVLLVAGESNAAVLELWQTTARRGFSQADGRRRLRDLVQGMVPVTVKGHKRWMIYPGRDDRVLRRQAEIGRREPWRPSMGEARPAPIDVGEPQGDDERGGGQPGDDAGATEGGHRPRGRHRERPVKRRPLDLVR